MKNLCLKSFLLGVVVILSMVILLGSGTGSSGFGKYQISAYYENDEDGVYLLNTKSGVLRKVSFVNLDESRSKDKWVHSFKYTPEF